MRHLPDILVVIGVITIVGGVALMHVPIATILAGVTIVGVGYLLHKRKEGE